MDRFSVRLLVVRISFVRMYVAPRVAALRNTVAMSPLVPLSTSVGPVGDIDHVDVLMASPATIHVDQSIE